MILKKDFEKYKFLSKNSCVKFYSASNNYCSPIVVAYEKSSPTKWPVGPREFSHYIVHYMFEGEGAVIYDNQKTIVKRDSIFTITPNQTLTEVQNPSNPWWGIWFELHGTECAKLFEQAGMPNHPIVYRVSNPEKFKYLFFDLLEDTQEHRDENGFIAMSHIYKIFEAISKEFSANKRNKLVQNELFEKIKAYIDKHFAEITPGQVAKEFFITPQHLDRLFKREIKTTPSKYIMDLKLDMSVNMLLKGTFSISSIAETLGFSSPYYFSSVFKKRFSVAPNYYKKYRRYQENEFPAWQTGNEDNSNQNTTDKKK